MLHALNDAQTSLRLVVEHAQRERERASFLRDLRVGVAGGLHLEQVLARRCFAKDGGRVGGLLGLLRSPSRYQLIRS